MADVSNAVSRLADAKVVKLAVGLIVGLGLGAMLSPSPVTLPVVGATSTLYVGAVAVIVGGGLYVGLDRRSSSSDCGCGSDCGC